VFPASRRAVDARDRGEGGLFQEALQPAFKTYQEQIIRNARSLAEG